MTMKSFYSSSVTYYSLEINCGVCIIPSLTAGLCIIPVFNVLGGQKHDIPITRNEDLHDDRFKKKEVGFVLLVYSALKTCFLPFIQMPFLGAR